MADYYPLIARAVTGLDKSTGEARRALYERARSALVTQLRGVEPALSEADITRERLALEEAIRKVEAEAARRPRQEPPEASFDHLAATLARFEKPSSSAEPESRPAAPPPPDWEELQRELDGLEPPPPPHQVDLSKLEAETHEPPPAESYPESAADEPPLPFEPESRPEPESAPEPTAPPEEPAAPEAPVPPPPITPRRFDKTFAEHPSLVDEGLKGFRDVIAETDDLGGATASASRSARDTRDAFAALPPSNEVERVEPRVDPRMKPRLGLDDLKQPEEGSAPTRAEARAGARGRPMTPPAARPMPEEFEELDGQPLRGGWSGAARKVVALVILLSLIGAGAFAYLQWGDNLSGMFQSARVPATQAPKEAQQARPKISDRIGGTQDSSARAPSGPEAAVAQRAVLFEQPAKAGERGQQFVGSVIWRTEASSSGQPADVAMKAEVEIPERHIRMSLVIRRNLDASLPASHTIEVLFSTPADFPAGGIANLGGVLMENNPQGRGEPINGVGVKVTNGFFLVGLTSGDSFVRRNMQLLKERAWMNLQLVYNDGQRALLLIEKGLPGERVMDDVLNAWGQTPPSSAESSPVPPSPAQQPR